jgi:hypothetical protein
MSCIERRLRSARTSLGRLLAAEELGQVVHPGLGKGHIEVACLNISSLIHWGDCCLHGRWERMRRWKELYPHSRGSGTHVLLQIDLRLVTLSICVWLSKKGS